MHPDAAPHGHPYRGARRGHAHRAGARIGAGYVLPGIVGQLVTWLGYGLGVVGWLGLPLYVLLLALRCFPVPRPSPRGGESLKEFDHD